MRHPVFASFRRIFMRPFDRGTALSATGALKGMDPDRYRGSFPVLRFPWSGLLEHLTLSFGTPRSVRARQ